MKYNNRGKKNINKERSYNGIIIQSAFFQKTVTCLAQAVMFKQIEPLRDSRN